MPEVIVKYKNKKSLQLLEDLSKYHDFKLIPTKAEQEKKKKKLLNGIKQGLKEVKLIQEGKLKPITMKQLLDEL